MQEWKSDNGDGTYTNPVLYADYSDPDAIRVGADYYLIASSFSNTPGIPVLHSKDLVNWEIINYVLKKLPHPGYDRPVHGCGVWASAIRYHGGLFYVCFPMPDEGLYMCTADDPRGEWSEPVCIWEGSGRIDPCPFWDEDGRAYLVSGVAKSRIGYKSVLHLQELSPDGRSLIGEPVVVFDGNENDQETIEGPKLYKRNGWYYIFAPAGGVKTGWQTVLRSRNIFGPYEYRVVMRQGASAVNGPHQGAWVDTVTGEDWFLHFQDVYAAGRIVHLQPMRWEGDWPVIGKSRTGEVCGEPVHCFRKPDTGRAVSEEVLPGEGFRDQVTPKNGGPGDGSLSKGRTPAVTETPFVASDPGWQWNANGKQEWYDTDNDAVILYAATKEGPYGDLPNLLLRKWEAPEFSRVFTIDLTELGESEEAGVISMGMEYGLIGFVRQGEAIRVFCVRGKQRFGKILVEETVEERQELGVLPAGAVMVHVRYEVVRSGRRDLSETEKDFPEETVRLSYYTDDENERTGLTMSAVPGRWVGVKYGIFCAGNAASPCGRIRFRL